MKNKNLLLKTIDTTVQHIVCKVISSIKIKLDTFKIIEKEIVSFLNNLKTLQQIDSYSLGVFNCNSKNYIKLEKGKSYFFESQILFFCSKCR